MNLDNFVPLTAVLEHHGLSNDAALRVVAESGIPGLFTEAGIGSALGNIMKRGAQAVGRTYDKGRKAVQNVSNAAGEAFDTETHNISNKPVVAYDKDGVLHFTVFKDLDLSRLGHKEVFQGIVQGLRSKYQDVRVPPVNDPLRQMASKANTTVFEMPDNNAKDQLVNLLNTLDTKVSAYRDDYASHNFVSPMEYQAVQRELSQLTGALNQASVAAAREATSELGAAVTGQAGISVGHTAPEAALSQGTSNRGISANPTQNNGGRAAYDNLRQIVIPGDVRQKLQRAGDAYNAARSVDNTTPANAAPVAPAEDETPLAPATATAPAIPATMPDYNQADLEPIATTPATDPGASFPDIDLPAPIPTYDAGDLAAAEEMIRQQREAERATEPTPMTDPSAAMRIPTTRTPDIPTPLRAAPKLDLSAIRNMNQADRRKVLDAFKRANVRPEYTQSDITSPTAPTAPIVNTPPATNVHPFNPNEYDWGATSRASVQTNPGVTSVDKPSLQNYPGYGANPEEQLFAYPRKAAAARAVK